MAKRQYTFVDLFAGAGGLSEGFIRAGFQPIAHVEMDHYACDTLRTRAAFHYLKDNGRLDEYAQYLIDKKLKEALNENEYLKAEVALLKKVKALMAAEERKNSRSRRPSGH